jgi:hypothetical protein
MFSVVSTILLNLDTPEEASVYLTCSRRVQVLLPATCSPRSHLTSANHAGGTTT